MRPSAPLLRRGGEYVAAPASRPSPPPLAILLAPQIGEDLSPFCHPLNVHFKTKKLAVRSRGLSFPLNHTCALRPALKIPRRGTSARPGGFTTQQISPRRCAVIMCPH